MKKKQNRPDKPYPDFPLYPHATKRWVKKIRGKIYYFGPWDKPDEAVELYLKQRDDLYAGRKPREAASGATVHELVNRFLHAKKMALETGELTQRSWDDYQRTCNLILKVFGAKRVADDIDQDDFGRLRARIAKSLGLVALGNEVGRCRVVFNYGWKTKILKNAPDYGLSFSKPSKKALRIDRAKRPKKLFEAIELRRLFYASDTQLRAMVLLGANCGLGNNDCAQLRMQYLDLRQGWLNYSRPKTGVDRRAKLWPETIEAIKGAMEATEKTRKSVAREDKSLVFITRFAAGWHGGPKACPISSACRKALQAAGIYRPGLSFYALRHTFQTIGERSRDSQAVSAIMGHIDGSMAGVYREEFDDDRLIAVAETVRDWLFPRPTTGY